MHGYLGLSDAEMNGTDRFVSPWPATTGGGGAVDIIMKWLRATEGEPCAGEGRSTPLPGDLVALSMLPPWTLLSLEAFLSHPASNEFEVMLILFLQVSKLCSLFSTQPSPIIPFLLLTCKRNQIHFIIKFYINLIHLRINKPHIHDPFQEM